jgi:hypothetical protein
MSQQQQNKKPQPVKAQAKKQDNKKAPQAAPKKK